MKRNLLLLLLSSWATCNAQTDFRFADSTAQWNVLESWQQWCPCYTLNTTVYRISSDTVTNGLNYQVINGTVLLRRDSIGRVYKKSFTDTIENLIYDFSKIVGDTFSLNYSGSGILCQVDSIDTVTLDKPRKRMYVNLSGAQDIWVEGIGSLKSDFLSPGLQYTFVDGPYYSFLCFFSGNMLVYHDDTVFQTCIIDTVIWYGLKDMSSFFTHISPNPATTYLNITLQQTPSSQTTFQLFDITGRMVLQKPLTETSNQLSVEGLSKGLYLYNVVSEKQKEGSGKLVIE